MSFSTQVPLLKAGDRVALVAPSGPANQEHVDGAIALVESWGLVAVPGPNIMSRHPRAPYLAGSDAERAADLQAAWCDDSVQAVFCIRGGYGTVRVLDLLDKEALRAAKPKVLIGSSDITGLIEFWDEHLGLPSIFAPMIGTDAVLKQPGSTEAQRRALFEPMSGLEIADPAAQTLVPGVVNGQLTGGNMALLVMSTGAHGADYQRAAGKIVLLEDVTEDPYKLDGMLHTLIRSGYFEGALGIALGTWEQCGELSDVRALMEEMLIPLGIPLVWGLRFGHGPDVVTVPLGVNATLYADERPRIVID